jgi:putative glutathione S-transferase
LFCFGVLCRIYHDINNGVYKNGFAKSQEAYEKANEILFNSLNRLDALLATRKYICGDVITASDIRCFQTLIRFDEVYAVYFKCDRKKISEYKNIMRYCADLWLIDGIKNTINMKHIKQHYYCSHSNLNYLGIVPVGPNFIGALETYSFNSGREPKY